MSLPIYLDTKHSGVDWLGEIPSHWTVKKLKYVCTNQPSNVDKKSVESEKAVSLCNYTDVYYNDVITPDLPFMQATATDDQIEKFTLRASDVIITKDSESADDIAVSTYVPEDMPGVVCGYHLAMIRPTKGVCGLYIKRLFDSAYIQSKVATLANGLTRVGLSHAAVGGLELPMPPDEDEQKAITSFLDVETSKIDSLVSEQRRLIELLKEKRQAVISHAVTKGLNPNAPMKPSGIKWLGGVPQHWEVSRVKFMVQPNDGIQMGPFGGMLLDLDGFDTGYKVFGQENTISGDFTRGQRWISQERYAELVRYAAKDGDLVLTRKGSLGNARLILDLPQPGIIDSDTIRIRVDDDIVASRFLARLLHEAPYIMEQINRMKRGAILPGLNTGIIANLVIVLPGRIEQNELLNHLDSESLRFDTLLAEAERAIELLQERRTALISAAVTGKIDVRQFQHVVV